MTKREFLRRLRKKLNCNDKDDIIAYYNELIEDKMDKTGLTEEEVIDRLDDIDDIVRKTNSQSGVYQKNMMRMKFLRKNINHHLEIY